MSKETVIFLNWAFPAVLVYSVPHLMASVCPQNLLLAWAGAAVDVAFFCPSKENIRILKEREKWPGLDGFIPPADEFRGREELLGRVEPQHCTSAGCVQQCTTCWGLTPGNLGFSAIHVENAGILGVLCGGSAQLSPGCGRCWTNSPRLGHHTEGNHPKEMWVTWLWGQALFNHFTHLG